jgi:two-component system sensor histidine kinase AlgZ
MAGTRDLVLVHQDTRLPRELIWLYLLVPWVATPVLDERVFTAPPTQALLTLASLYVPFLGLPAAFHAFHAWVMPHVVGRLGSPARRWSFHVVATTAIAVGGGAALYPVHELFCPNDVSLPPFLVACVFFCWSFIFPTLIVQELRARAANGERLAHAQQQAALEAQLQAIQARTNPHFFFNSINTVASLIPDDPALAEDTLLRVADILRYALESSKTRFVPLGRELEVVRDYLEVQRARFGDRLRFVLDVDPDSLSLQVPPLILQPLVENAILHGVAQSTRGGQVRVITRRELGSVRITVEDDGPGGSTHKGTGTSMADLERRLSLLYGPAGQLEAGPAPTGGWRVAIGLPMQLGA